MSSSQPSLGWEVLEPGNGEGDVPGPKSVSVSPTGSSAFSSIGVPATLFRLLVLTGVSLSCGLSRRFRMGRITLLGMEGDRKSWRHLLRLTNLCRDKSETWLEPHSGLSLPHGHGGQGSRLLRPGRGRSCLPHFTSQGGQFDPDTPILASRLV